jgi:methionine synthase II (cobalamin-independent)
MTRPVTGVGSLPHSDPAEAARFVAGTATVPYLPQLPNLDPEEGMLLQWGDGLCGSGRGPGGLGLAAGAKPGDRARAFVGGTAVLDLLEPATRRVKTQATGPLTLAAALAAGGFRGDPRPCLADGLAERIAGHLELLAARLPGTEVTLILDEPALAVPGSIPGGAGGTGVLADLIAGFGAGIHCCGDADWEAVARLRPAALSVDTASLGPRFADAAPAIAEALSDGTRMIWGAVPVSSPPLPSVGALVGRVRRAEGVLVLAGADLAALEAAWVTPACGLAGLTEDQAGAVAARVIEVAEALG